MSGFLVRRFDTSTFRHLTTKNHGGCRTCFFCTTDEARGKLGANPRARRIPSSFFPSPEQAITAARFTKLGSFAYFPDQQAFRTPPPTC